MTNPTLEHLIKDFSTDGVIRFFRERSTKFATKKERLDDYNDASFKAGFKLGEIKFDEIEEIIICAFLCDNSLSERSGKKAQYEKAKQVLKNRISDAGIFIFYDTDGNFRFSLVYTNYLGKKKDWSTFKRFTYFVNKESTNKTFLQRIGNGDFSTLGKIQEAFSVEKVTKEFYENISYWYFWAVKKCSFPKEAEAEENGRNISVIRLITRIIFVWFMRERKLIRKELFDKETIDKLLNDTSNDTSSYYQAILQNLFFATLSTKQEDRQFRSELRGSKGFNPDHGNPYVFRFQDCFIDPKKVRELFVDIPFLNGGLFDCLDDSEKGIYIDGFSEIKKNQAIVPNILFFGKETRVDLTSDLGPQQKNCMVKGLINLLSEFNFTIDENTTDDKDVALDPELLGRVFENLLASFNPETSTTARKATGSYYTPREIVDYMVDESLKGYFSTHLTDIEDIDNKLGNLFSQEIEENPFNTDESKRIVNLIESVRVADPAVGSGAFPMGILNRLVFLLHKVDPDNGFWKQEQLNAVEQISDPRIKQETRTRIEAYFEKNDNYGRKLFLIQKCIYGVDIQQIAVEIAKLRFFISLLVDEDVDKNKPNWGIEPLPNLDFKIMQGNSLISEIFGIRFEIDKKESMEKTLFDSLDEENKIFTEFDSKKSEYQNEVDKNIKSRLFKEIEEIMIRIYENIVRKQKASYFKTLMDIEERYSKIPNKNDREETIPQEKQKANQHFNFDLENAEKQLREYNGKIKIRPFFPWQLYFAEVFIEKGGFDVVIANPPYIGEKSHKEIFHEVKQANLGKFYMGKMDLFYFFFHLALEIGKPNALVAFITTNYYPTASGAVKLRKDFKKRTIINKLINFNELKIFESALGQHNMITILQKGQDTKAIAKTCITAQQGITSPELLTIIANGQDCNTKYFEVAQEDIYEGNDCLLRLTGTAFENKDPIHTALNKIITQGVVLGSICYVNQGIVSGADKVSKKHIEKYKLKARKGEGIFVLSENEVQKLNLTMAEKKIFKPWFKNSDIFRWGTNIYSDESVIYADKRLNNLNGNSIKEYLNKFKEIIDNSSVNSPYLHRPRDINFDSSKIVVPQRSMKNTFGYNEIPWYASADVYFITLKDPKYNLKFILALLNSSIYYLWLYHRGKRKGEALELYQQPLSKIPIKLLSGIEQKPFIALVDQILSLTSSDDYQKNSEKQALVKKYEEQIDNMVYVLYGLTGEEIAAIDKGVNHSRKTSLDKGEVFIDRGA